MGDRQAPGLTSLCTYSYFSEGRGVSSPHTLAERAAELGYTHLALVDELSVAGAVDLHLAASKVGLKPLVGATLPLEHGGQSYPVVLLAASRAGYQNLNELITQILLTKSKTLALGDLLEHQADLFLLSGGRSGFATRLLEQRLPDTLSELLHPLGSAFKDRLFIQLYRDRYRGDRQRLHLLRRLAWEQGLPVAAAPETRMARPELFPLYDALLCARLGITAAQPHPERPQNKERHLPSRREAFRRIPFLQAWANAEAIAQECSFELLPRKLVPPAVYLPEGTNAHRYLEARCRQSLPRLYSPTEGAKAEARLAQELDTIAYLGWNEHFLAAAEITDYCRGRGILAAGRGSAAGSVVCYLLGITYVDPIHHDLLFERFLHKERSQLPDIDIDIASSRRDEVLDWVEERFGGSGRLEAMTANRITYRLPSAIQDLGRALDIPPQQRNQLTDKLGRDYRHLSPARARQAEAIFAEVLGHKPERETLLGLLELMEPGHVRHLGPHSGGVILSSDALTLYSPLERSTGGIRHLQFDKEDIEHLGLIKLDLLGLRMLAALERAREEIYRLEERWIDLGALPDEPKVWEQIAEGDTMALFQIESPGQVRVSVQLKPQTLTDLAHQIALFRPGPIQSGTVHPYLQRRQGLEAVTYIHPALEPILGKTQGVLLYQEQFMRIGVEVAGMTWVEADRFRKRVSGFRGLEDMEPEREAFIHRVIHKVGASYAQANALFEMLKAFSGFGFAESHAAAFALHCYASVWVRLHYPAEYLAAFLSEHPGMWPRMTLRQEAKRWRVALLELDINQSGVYYQAERLGSQKAVRVSLHSVKGVSEDVAGQIVLERARGSYASVEDLYHRVKLSQEVLEALAQAGAFDRLCSRREALYRVGALQLAQPAGNQPLLAAPLPDAPELAALNPSQKLVWDMRFKGLSESSLHPLDLVRHRLKDMGCTPLARLNRPGYQRTRTAGLVISKQKPGTAKGYAFFMIEDGSTRCQVVIGPELWQQEYATLRDAPALVVEGLAETRGKAITLRAERIWGLPLALAVRGYHF